MLGADTFISALLRIVGTVAVLAAVYFFIVKPVLHTTEKVSHEVNHSVNQSFRQSQRQQRAARRQTHRALRQANQAIQHAGLQAQKATVKVRKAVHGQTSVAGLPKHAQKVIRCLQNAAGDVTKLEKCH